jgi:hypothetical protein
MTLWIVTIASLLVAAAALAHSRRTARKLAMLEDQYWQLKFDHGELKAKLDPAPPPAREAAPTFVPLTALRSAAAETGGAGPPKQ